MTGAVETHEQPEERALVTSLRAGDEQTFAALVGGAPGWMLRPGRDEVSR